MIAVGYLVSWNQGSVDAVRTFAQVGLALCVFVAVFMVTPVLVAAVTPTVIGCCSAAVAALPNACIAAGIIGAAVAMFKWGG